MKAKQNKRKKTSDFRLFSETVEKFVIVGCECAENYAR